jgi:hypothetical protein
MEESKIRRYMSDKSYVSMERKKCIIDGNDYDTNSILLDRRLKDSMERYTTTGWGLCPQCESKTEEYLALVEIDPDKSGTKAGQHIQPEEAYRTGNIIHIRRTVAKDIFNIPVSSLPVVFIDSEVSAKIKSMMPHA